MKEYKVITQSDSFWRDRMKPDTLERGLNSLAEEGWEVKAITTGEYFGFGQRNETIIILEREKAPSTKTTVGREVISVGIYDIARIPQKKYYAGFGKLDYELLRNKLLSQDQYEKCRLEVELRGGTAIDHAFAYGFIDDSTLRSFMKKERCMGV